MSTLFDILIGGSSSADFAANMAALEIEENIDLPGAFSLTLPVAVTDTGDYDTISDTRLAPLSNICITAQAADGVTQCIFDGYVLAQEIHLDTGTSKSTIKVWGQDASWLMNTQEVAKQWPDVTEGSAANSIFSNYGFTPDSGNLDGDSSVYSTDTATLMQRGTDAQFLRRLAQRSGKFFRVFCTGTPGDRIGYFGMPDLSSDPAITLILNDANAANIAELDIAFDVMRPSTVNAFQTLFTDPANDGSGAGGAVTDTGLAALGDNDLAALTTANPVSALLTTQASDAGTITQRATAMLREAGWFARCKGSTDAERLGAILRVGSVVALNAAGTIHSGKYLVWSVRHNITTQKHEMHFTLVRNAIGTAPAASPSLGAGL